LGVLECEKSWLYSCSTVQFSVAPSIVSTWIRTHGQNPLGIMEEGGREGAEMGN